MTDAAAAVDFSEARLRRLLRRAGALGYAAARYGAEEEAGERFVLWRHDVDTDLDAAVRLGEWEAEEGVRSTYFLLLRSWWYNLLAPDGERAVARLAALGHDLALHCDLGLPREAPLDAVAVRRRVARDHAVLDAAYPGVFRRVVSFHLPPAGVVRRELAGVHSAYEPRYLDGMAYVSDSARRFRAAAPEALLESGEHRRLCVLLHPESWTAGGSTLAEGVAELLATRERRTHAELRAMEIEL